ncbi:MAG: hypothetical protein BWY38_03155 [Ignavibacteria bacterium ADurb.Bin266]|nr:MAG: hypothetical protein BWY38_03155 [Ignavibacteria bacterium ADurb.Bin266]
MLDKEIANNIDYLINSMLIQIEANDTYTNNLGPLSNKRKRCSNRSEYIQVLATNVAYEQLLYERMLAAFNVSTESFTDPVSASNALIAGIKIVENNLRGSNEVKLVSQNLELLKSLNEPSQQIYALEMNYIYSTTINLLLQNILPKIFYGQMFLVLKSNAQASVDVAKYIGNAVMIGVVDKLEPIVRRNLSCPTPRDNFINQDVLNKVTSTTEPPKAQSNSSEGCFIATAVFGNYEHPVVREFRFFRDTTLSKYKIGKSAIAAYYRISPSLVPIISSKPFASVKFLLKGLLMCFYFALKRFR